MVMIRRAILCLILFILAPLSAQQHANIETSEQLMARDKVAQLLGCTAESLLNNSWAPVAKADDAYTQEELRINFLRAIAPSYKGNLIEYLDHLTLIDTSDLQKISGTLSKPDEISKKTRRFVELTRKSLQKIESLRSALGKELHTDQVLIVPSEFGLIMPITSLNGTINTPHGQKRIAIKLDTSTAIWFIDINNNKFLGAETEEGMDIAKRKPYADAENTQGDAELLSKIVTVLEKNIDIKDLPYISFN